MSRQRRRTNVNDPTARLATQEDELLSTIVDGYLDFREATVISMRFGVLADDRPATRRRVAEVMGITERSVRHIEARALKKLRLPWLRVRDGFHNDVIDAGRGRGFVVGVPDDKDLGMIRCQSCDQRFRPKTARTSGRPIGRPRKYCTDKCRQAAYRARRARDAMAQLSRRHASAHRLFPGTGQPGPTRSVTVVLSGVG